MPAPPTSARTLIIAFAVMPIALACCRLIAIDRCAGMPAEARAPELYALGEDRDSRHPHGFSLARVASRYRVGMSREEIRRRFGLGARLVASDVRPDKNWGTKGISDYGLARSVLESERGVLCGRVAACEVYDDGQYHHVLFFDEAGVLLGVRWYPSILYSGFAQTANRACHAAAASTPIASDDMNGVAPGQGGSRPAAGSALCV